jgi:hypothetical protein
MEMKVLKLLAIDPGTDWLGWAYRAEDGGLDWGECSTETLLRDGLPYRPDVLLSEWAFGKANIQAALLVAETVGRVEGLCRMRARTILATQWRRVLELPQNSGSVNALRARLEREWNRPFPARDRKRDGARGISHHALDALAILTAWQIAPEVFR